MSDDTYSFYVEELGEGNYRATYADDYTMWGHGETPWQAIMTACELYDESEADNGEITQT